MNNTRTLAIVAVLTAATLVVGGTFAATSAFAYVKKGPQDNKKGARDNGSGNGNGNTIVERCSMTEHNSIIAKYITQHSLLWLGA
jgi:hypothetical protein